MNSIIQELALAGAATLAMLLAMTAAWLTQRSRENGGWIDVFWAFGTGVCVGLAALAPYGNAPGAGWRRGLVAALMLAWGVRLGVHIVGRAARALVEDPRYAAFRRDWGGDFQRRMFSFALMQALFSGALALSVIVAALTPAPAFRLQDGLALAVFMVAVVGEAVADGQLGRFRARRRNTGKVCEEGLWGWSRHPNYFFEALLWLAWPIMGLDAARPWTLVTLIAPILMYLTIRFASGVPPLEAAMLASRGAAYADYQRRVSVIIPLPPRRRTGTGEASAAE